MARNSKTTQTGAASSVKLTPTQIARIAIGALLVVNLLGLWMVFNPPGGSAEGLQGDLARLQSQLQQAKTRLESAKVNAVAVEKGRGAADQFLAQYFVTRRTVPTTLLTELREIARRAGIKQQPSSNYSPEAIEGSETLGMITITTSFEGTYRNLLDFVREIDRSGSLFIIDSLSAAPQSNTNLLTVAIKMEAFIREDTPLTPPEGAAIAEVLR